jgi:preprotein translocase subunit SecB
MAEDAAPGTETTAGQAGAQRAQMQTVPITVTTQYLKDLSFENPGAPATSGAGQMPQGRVDVDVRAKSLGESGYEVSLILRAEARRDGEPVFVVEVEYAGVFVLTNVPQEAIEPVLLIECPRLLFPFARAILSNATQDGGYAPLLVNPIDFAQLYRVQRMRQSQTATA